MKNMFRGFVAVLLFVVFASASFGEVPKQVIDPPRPFVKEILISPKAVRYNVRDYRGRVSAVFTADHNRRLRSLQLVMRDQTVYKWDCQYVDDGKVDLSERYENGVHLNNRVLIDRRKWLEFFGKEIVLPEFRFLPE